MYFEQSRTSVVVHVSGECIDYVPDSFLHVIAGVALLE